MEFSLIDIGRGLLAQIIRIPRCRHRLFPLPGGEGQGEGIGTARLIQTTDLFEPPQPVYASEYLNSPGPLAKGRFRAPIVCPSDVPRS